MSVTPEELAAFADGQLDAARAAEVADAVAADPVLARQVEAHAALRTTLAAHFAPIMAAPVPARLAAPLQPPAEIIDLGEARARRMRRVARWSWAAGPALAASLALAMFLPRGGGYADAELANALDRQLVTQQTGREAVHVLLTFRDRQGTYCRAFGGSAQSGIACREAGGWRLRMTGKGAGTESGDYRTAGSPAARIMEAAQGMSQGPALTAAEEQQARARHWR